MSKDEKPKIDESPRRYFKSHKNPENPRVVCYLGIRKVTFGELREHFAERYPEVDFDSLVIGGLQLQWEDEPWPDELAARERQRRAYDERHEQWERKTYERLRVKFEGYDVMDVVK
jgi:hypothetical protein